MPLNTIPRPSRGPSTAEGVRPANHRYSVRFEVAPHSPTRPFKPIARVQIPLGPPVKRQGKGHLGHSLISTTDVVESRISVTRVSVVVSRSSIPKPPLHLPAPSRQLLRCLRQGLGLLSDVVRIRWNLPGEGTPHASVVVGAASGRVHDVTAVRSPVLYPTGPRLAADLRTHDRSPFCSNDDCEILLAKIRCSGVGPSRRWPPLGNHRLLYNSNHQPHMTQSAYAR